jgi:allophanate hydrolase subunit 2
VAFRGGIAVDEVLGSRSTDLLSGLGPAPLADGAVLPLGPPPPGRAPVALDVPRLPALPSGGLTLRVRLGPRHDWFTPAALRVLDAAEFRVSASSNRVGMRTEGPALERARDGELASEGMVLGAIQVPPDGRPVVFLADHPTTGGYPVIGVVDRADLPGAAQAPPGTPVRFTLTGPRGVGAAPSGRAPVWVGGACPRRSPRPYRGAPDANHLAVATQGQGQPPEARAHPQPGGPFPRSSPRP